VAFLQSANLAGMSHLRHAVLSSGVAVASLQNKEMSLPPVFRPIATPHFNVIGTTDFSALSFHIRHV
jgi:hypothetical protein